MYIMRIRNKAIDGRKQNHCSCTSSSCSSSPSAYPCSSFSSLTFCYLRKASQCFLTSQAALRFMRYPVLFSMISLNCRQLILWPRAFRTANIRQQSLSGEFSPYFMRSSIGPSMHYNRFIKLSVMALRLERKMNLLNTSSKIREMAWRAPSITGNAVDSASDFSVGLDSSSFSSVLRSYESSSTRQHLGDLKSFWQTLYFWLKRRTERLFCWQNSRMVSLISSASPTNTTTAAASREPFFLGVSPFTFQSLCRKRFSSDTGMSRYFMVNSCMRSLSRFSCSCSLRDLELD